MSMIVFNDYSVAIIAVIIFSVSIIVIFILIIKLYLAMCSNIWILKFLVLLKTQMSKYLLNGRAYRYLSPLDVYYAWYIYHVYCAWQKKSSGDS